MRGVHDVNGRSCSRNYSRPRSPRLPRRSGRRCARAAHDAQYWKHNCCRVRRGGRPGRVHDQIVAPTSLSPSFQRFRSHGKCSIHLLRRRSPTAGYTQHRKDRCGEAVHQLFAEQHRGHVRDHLAQGGIRDHRVEIRVPRGERDGGDWVLSPISARATRPVETRKACTNTAEGMKSDRKRPVCGFDPAPTLPVMGLFASTPARQPSFSVWPSSPRRLAGQAGQTLMFRSPAVPKAIGTALAMVRECAAKVRVPTGFAAAQTLARRAFTIAPPPKVDQSHVRTARVQTWSPSARVPHGIEKRTAACPCSDHRCVVPGGLPRRRRSRASKLP